MSAITPTFGGALDSSPARTSVEGAAFGLSFVLDDLVDSLGTAIVVIDGELVIHQRNRAAHKLLAELQGVVSGDTTLCFFRPALEQQFQSLCTSIVRDVQRSAQPVTRTLRVPRAANKSDLIMLVHVRPAWLELANPRPAILVVMMDLDVRVEATELLKELNGFTRSESIVVQRLLAGNRLAEIGRQLDMAPETVRAHIKHAFKKCGVHSQAQLVHRVAVQLFTLAHFCGL